MAYLPPETVQSLFRENLFDLPQNQEAFEQMVGLGTHTPFECIGQIEESRIAMRLCVTKGFGGRATSTLLPRLPAPDLDAGGASAEMVVFYFGNAGAGSLQANLDSCF